LNLLFRNRVEATRSCGTHLRCCMHFVIYFFDFVLVYFLEAEDLAGEVFSCNIGLECTSDNSLVSAKEQKELLELCG